MVNISQKQLLELRTFAEDVILSAGNLVESYRQKAVVVQQKDIQDIATNADLASEQLIVDAIHQTFPLHGINSEERGLERENSDFVWIIDPLDGTKEFVRGIPLYNVAMILMHKREPVVAAVYCPAYKQLFSASKNCGAYLNKQQIKVSAEDRLEASFMYTYLPCTSKQKDKKNHWRVLENIEKFVYRLRSSSDINAGLCWLANGGFEAYFLDLGFVPEWRDIGPGLFIAQEAGARITTMNGDPVNQTVHETIIATNGKIHDRFIHLLQDCKE